MHQLYDRHLGPDWPERCSEGGCWETIESVSDGELWETHQTLKVKLVETARRRVTVHAERRGDTPEFIAQLRRALSFDALTIGFARRFATYKRSGLVFKDVERLAELMLASNRPVQFIFAGKAHPEDRFGKELIQGIIRLTKQERFAQRIVFVEDYDMNVARHLVQGVDVWLNTPRRPLEASGTSGMKAAMNGVPSLSILDGWWAEAFDGTNGWAIGRPADDGLGTDAADAATLYGVLEDEVIPAFYERDEDGLPRRWLGFMRGALEIGMTRFSADRLLADYVNELYRPIARAGEVVAPRT
jgi:glycogen phosphorylase